MREDTFLGKKVEYTGEYNPNLLVPVPRQHNRSLIDISDDALPFVGYDVWNGYELSCLNKNGVPIVGVVKIVYPCNSKNIVESKSLKLYLNSFNMTRIDAVLEDNIFILLQKTIKKDLENIIEAPVNVNIFNLSTNTVGGLGYLWDSLERKIDKDIECNIYNETPSLLAPVKEYEILIDKRYHAQCLRSNCKVTKQPDWGDVYIKYVSYKVIDPNNLFKYLVSFRNEAHFHEEICETIYKRIYDTVQPVSLMVACFYTRRGGIDINPIRSLLPTDLIYFNSYIQHMERSPKSIRQ